MAPTTFLETFILQGVAALKLKGNLYFLISLHTQSNKQIFWLWTQSAPHKSWMKYCPVRHFVSRTTFHLKEYTSLNIPITVIFNPNIMSITAFQKLVTVSIRMLNNLLLNKIGGVN